MLITNCSLFTYINITLEGTLTRKVSDAVNKIELIEFLYIKLLDCEVKVISWV